MKNAKVGDRVRLYIEPGCNEIKFNDGEVVGIPGPRIRYVKFNENEIDLVHESHLIRLKRKKKPIRVIFDSVICASYTSTNRANIATSLEELVPLVGKRVRVSVLELP